MTEHDDTCTTCQDIRAEAERAARRVYADMRSQQEERTRRVADELQDRDRTSRYGGVQGLSPRYPGETPALELGSTTGEPLRVYGDPTAFDVTKGMGGTLRRPSPYANLSVVVDAVREVPEQVERLRRDVDQLADLLTDEDEQRVGLRRVPVAQLVEVLRRALNLAELLLVDLDRSGDAMTDVADVAHKNSSYQGRDVSSRGRVAASNGVAATADGTRTDEQKRAGATPTFTLVDEVPAWQRMAMLGPLTRGGAAQNSRPRRASLLSRLTATRITGRSSRGGRS